MLVIAFVLALIFSFVVAIILLRPPAEQTAVRRRLHALAHVQLAPSVADANLKAEPEGTHGLVYRIGQHARRFAIYERIELLLLHSGSTASVGSVLALSFVSAVGAALFAHVLVGLLPLDIAAFGAGAGSRWGLLVFARSRRMNNFSKALPDAIELMARALRAGHSIASSIDIVASQSAQPLAAEFGTVFQQGKFGVPFRETLLDLGERVPSKDLHFLITAILVQRETGGDLTEILDRTTTVIRERIRIEGEIRTYTAQGRLTGWILSALPLVMLTLISFITPGYTHILFHDPLGQDLLYAGATLIVIGGFIIGRIVDIQV